jgi:hypothetical protein
MLVRRYGTSYACRLIILLSSDLRPSVFSRCYSFSLSDPTPLCCHCRRPKGMDSTQLRRDTTPLCLPAVAEPKICVKACVMNMLFSCLPGHASNCPAPTVTYACWSNSIDDPCGLLWWSDCEWSIRFVAHDQKGWKGRSSSCHRG